MFLYFSDSKSCPPDDSVVESANEREGKESAVESESEIRNTCRIPIQFCSENVQLNKETAEALKLNKAAAEALKSSKTKPTSKRITTTHDEKCSIQRQLQNRLLTKHVTEKSYNGIDICHNIPDFQPHSEPGGHLDKVML